MDEATLEKYSRISWGEIKKNITEKTPFEAISPMATCLIRVKAYEPMIALAPHAGHRVREELQSKMEIEEEERLKEEDPYVEQFIANAPFQMICIDSRFEYDVNRPRPRSVYLKPFESWGKKVWNHPPTKDELEISYQKYDEFHELLQFFMEELSTQCKKMVLIDMHTYNFRRPSLTGRQDSLPVLNLGTKLIDRKKHSKALDHVFKELQKIRLPGVENTVQENGPFCGDGQIAKVMADQWPDTLFLNIEVKKIFMNEESGEPDKKLLQAFSESLQNLGQLALNTFGGK